MNPASWLSLAASTNFTKPATRGMCSSEKVFNKPFIQNDLYIHYIQTQHTLHHENIHSGRKIFSSPNDKSRLFSACELSVDSLRFFTFAHITPFPLSLSNVPHPYSWHLRRFSVQQSSCLRHAEPK